MRENFPSVREEISNWVVKVTNEFPFAPGYFSAAVFYPRKY